MKNKNVTNYLTEIKMLINSIDEIQYDTSIDPDKKLLLANNYYKSLHKKTKEYIEFVKL